MTIRGKKERERGQGMTEYIIIVAVIAILSLAVVTAFGNQIRDLFFGSGEALATGSGEVTIENQMGDREEMVNRQLGSE